MLIAPHILKRAWGLSPQKILHVGAHEAEEMDMYLAAGWGGSGVLWVEALPEKVELIRHKLLTRGLEDHDVILATCWSESGVELSFHETNNGESSSVLELEEHLDAYPEIKVVNSHHFTSSALRDVVPDGYGPIDLLNLDIQGAELEALRGLGSLIDEVGAVYSEINLRPLYSGAVLLRELDEWLSGKGFKLVDIVTVPEGWGDGLWVRKDSRAKQIRTRTLYRSLLQALDKFAQFRRVMLSRVVGGHRTRFGPFSTASIVGAIPKRWGNPEA